MIRFEKVSKEFGGAKSILSDLSFEIAQGETLVILGRSGSGKTTALRLMNRMLEPTFGNIFILGKNILTHDPIALRRKVGYAIQQIGLFPHMTVEENISIVPRLLGWSKQKISSRCHQLLEMVGMNDTFSKRYPHDLSGGQMQRVGVARAIAADPPIILMDEPFGAIDPIMRKKLQDEFLQIQATMKKTVVFVTHDISEAVMMGNRIAVLEKGQLMQIATPTELLEKPASPVVEALFNSLKKSQTLESIGP